MATITEHAIAGTLPTEAERIRLRNDAIAWEVAARLHESHKVGVVLTARYATTIEVAIAMYQDESPRYLSQVVVDAFKDEAHREYGTLPTGLRRGVANEALIDAEAA